MEGMTSFVLKDEGQQKPWFSLATVVIQGAEMYIKVVQFTRHQNAKGNVGAYLQTVWFQN